MLPDLPGMHNRATDTSLPLMELLCRIAGFGPAAGTPEWSKFCSPPEQEILQRLLQLGRVRKDLKEYLVKCEALGIRGHFVVASAATCIGAIIREYDQAIVRLSGNIQTVAPPTLNSIFSIASQFEGSLMACSTYMSWMIDDTKVDELFTGRLLDECYRRLEISHGSARHANEALFDALFGAFKRTLIPWLAYGFLDSRTDDFFIQEPVECHIYFREIAPRISSQLKAPGHFPARLVEKIAQYGYVRKFLGWRTKNILGDPVLEDQIVGLSDRLRSLHWKEYRSTALEDIVDSFGELYSHALFVNIFQKCKVLQILRSFQQMYLMGFVDLFDEFVAQANDSLSVPWTKQPNAINDVNVKLDLSFEATGNPRKYYPHVQTGVGSAALENIADRGISGFSFGIRETANLDNLPIWEYLELEFMVRHPLDWFFHPRAMAKYKQIFRFLLRMKRLNNAFCDLWSALRDAAIAKRLTQLDHQDMFYWQYMFTHVIAAVQGYIQVDVIDEAWQELQEKLTQLDDYLQLMEAHDAFLARISMHAMIDNEKLHKCISALVKTCLEVSDDILNQLSRSSDVEVNLECIRGKILDLYSILRMFVKLIQSMSDYTNTLPAYLALKLDFSSNFQLVLSRAEGRF